MNKRQYLNSTEEALMTLDQVSQTIEVMDILVREIKQKLYERDHQAIDFTPEAVDVPAAHPRLH